MRSMQPLGSALRKPSRGVGAPPQEIPDVATEALVADLACEGAAAGPVPLHRCGSVVLPFGEARGHQGRLYSKGLHQLAQG